MSSPLITTRSIIDARAGDQFELWPLRVRGQQHSDRVGTTCSGRDRTDEGEQRGNHVPEFQRRQWRGRVRSQYSLQPECRSQWRLCPGWFSRELSREQSGSDWRRRDVAISLADTSSQPRTGARPTERMAARRLLYFRSSAWNDDAEFVGVLPAESRAASARQGGNPAVTGWVPITTAQNVQTDFSLQGRADGISSTGGGASNCAVQNANNSACVSGFPQPSWQNVTISGQAAATIHARCFASGYAEFSRLHLLHAVVGIGRLRYGQRVWLWGKCRYHKRTQFE